MTGLCEATWTGQLGSASQLFAGCKDMRTDAEPFLQLAYKMAPLSCSFAGIIYPEGTRCTFTSSHALATSHKISTGLLQVLCRRPLKWYARAISIADCCARSRKISCGRIEVETTHRGKMLPCVGTQGLPEDERVEDEDIGSESQEHLRMK